MTRCGVLYQLPDRKQQTGNLQFLHQLVTCDRIIYNCTNKD